VPPAHDADYPPYLVARLAYRRVKLSTMASLTIARRAFATAAPTASKVAAAAPAVKAAPNNFLDK